MMLATVEDLQTVLDFDVDTARAQQVLEECSALVAAECPLVQFTREVDDVIVLRGTWDRVLPLPRSPVEDVSQVTLKYPAWTTLDDKTLDDFQLYTDGIRAELARRLSSPTNSTTSFASLRHHGWGGPDVRVQVTYTHGYAEVPDDVEAFVLAFARRAFVNPEQVMQKRFDDHSISIGSSIEEVSGPLKSELRALQRRYGHGNVSAVTL